MKRYLTILLLLVSINYLYGERINIHDNKLLLNLGFNEGTGTHPIDSSQYKMFNISTATNTGWVTGKYGSSIGFAGNGYIEIDYSTSAPITANASFGMWIYWTGGVWNYLLDKNPSAADKGAYIYLYNYDAGEAWKYVYEFGVGTAYGDTNNYSIVENQWQHLVMVADSTAGTLEFYIQGKLVKKMTGQTFDCSYSQKRLVLGANAAKDGGYTGKMDEVFIINRVLTAAEVWTIFTSGIVRHSD